jgi:hypothetical protein
MFREGLSQEKSATRLFSNAAGGQSARSAGRELSILVGRGHSNLPESLMEER